MHSPKPDRDVRKDSSNKYLRSQPAARYTITRNQTCYLSVLKMSATAFHSPFACFFQTMTYLPRLALDLPVWSATVKSKVPISYARSADCATSISVGCQLNSRLDKT